MGANRYLPGRWFGGKRSLWHWLPWRLGLGTRGERQAEKLLRSLGMRIIARSYRCPLGEIDLVALDGEVLVFVEVKTKSDFGHGEAWESVDRGKQKKLTRLASYFAKHEPVWSNRPSRFDVVSIEWNGSWFTPPRIRHFPDAFAALGPWRV